MPLSNLIAFSLGGELQDAATLTIISPLPATWSRS